MTARRSLGLGALLLVQACAGAGAGPSGGNPGSAGTTSTGSAGTGNGAGTTGGAGTSGTGTAGDTGTAGTGSPNFVLDCPTASPGTPSMRLLTRIELQNTLNDVFPEVKGQWSASLPASTISSHGFDNADTTTVGAQLAGAVLDAAKLVATAVTGSALSSILPCSTSSANRACAETFLNKYGQRLFRRPITTAEHDRYLSFFDASLAKSDFKTALKWMTVGLIQSPNAIYRSEVGTVSGGMRQLTPHEIATELAYTYTGTTPSDALISAASSNSLGDLAAQARTMLATPQGKQMLQRFFEQYLDYTSVTSLTKPKISNFATLSADMVQETRAFLDQVIVQGGGGVKQLLTANTTNPSKALATYYGTGDSYTGGFPMPSTDYASVTRPAALGVGVLAQGSFLSTHAGADVSSPTKRGLFTFYKLFCRPKLTIPKDVPALDTTTPMTDVHTTRDRYEKVHALTNGTGGNCASCHRQFDPLGFAFERFDEGGRYRAKENGYDLNSAGSVFAPDNSTINFTDEQDLMTQVANQPVIHQCLAAYLAAYAFGSDEACIGASQVTALQSGSIGIAEAFVRLTTEQHFTKRTSN